MRLTMRCEYGLRVMTDLARRGRAQTTLEEIARRERVPLTLMPGLMQALARAGLAQTTRGHGGGVRLARPAKEITARAVLEALERPVQVCRCDELREECPRGEATACSLRALWERTETAVLEVWGRTTLADLAGPKGRGSG